MSDKPCLGFIGLGNMGEPMAARLLDAGYQLTIWNRSPDKTHALEGKGATLGADPAAVAAASDVVLLSITDTDAVESVVFGAGGVASAAGRDKILIDTSSIEPEATRRMAARLNANTGMRWVDAPVSGGTIGAEQGTLVFMAGGRAEDVDAVRPVIEHLGQRLTHMGPNGAGQVTKVCNQMLVGGTIAVVAETLKMAADAGVEAAKLPDCLAGGFADSTILQVHGRRMISGDLEPRGRVTIMLKDMVTACQLSQSVGASVPITALATELFRLLVNQGHDNVDQGGLIRLYTDQPLTGD